MRDRFSVASHQPVDRSPDCPVVAFLCGGRFMRIQQAALLVLFTAATWAGVISPGYVCHDECSGCTAGSTGQHQQHEQESCQTLR